MLVGKYVFVIFLSVFVIRNFRGTCSPIEMLKGYIGRASLGTPDLNNALHFTELQNLCVGLLLSLTE